MYPQQLITSTFHPMPLTRQQLSEVCPWLVEMDQALREQGGKDVAVSKACAIQEQYLAPLLDFAFDPEKPVILLSLTEDYERFLTALSIETPGAGNLISPDGLAARPADIWQAATPAGLPSLCLDTGFLDIAYDWARSRLHPAQCCEIPTFQQIVIAFSGNMVSIGGFTASEDLYYGRCAVSSKAANWNPFQEFTQAELDAWAEKAKDKNAQEWGAVPFLDGRHNSQCLPWNQRDVVALVPAELEDI